MMAVEEMVVMVVAIMATTLMLTRTVMVIMTMVMARVTMMTAATTSTLIMELMLLMPLMPLLLGLMRYQCLVGRTFASNQRRIFSVLCCVHQGVAMDEDMSIGNARACVSVVVHSSTRYATVFRSRRRPC